MAPRHRREPARSAAPVLLLAAALAVGGVPRAGAAAGPPTESRCTESIPDVFDRVSPSVVFVSATSIDPYRLTDRVSHVVGSGIVVDRTGLVLTNSHVASGRQSIRVTLDDDTVLDAELVGADPIFDLAVLRIAPPPGSRLPVAVLGDSDTLRVGDEVLAIGNPLGLDQTLTRGIVSALNRVLPDTPFSVLEPLIQTDTPINPGNSGGPLVNRCGEVIGVNTATLVEAPNIGFAIPVNLAKAVLPALVARGRVIRPWLGFHGQLVGDELRGLLRAPLVDGLLIEVIEPGSPAEAAGLRGGRLDVVIAGREFLVGGDIVTRVNGVALDSSETLLRVMRGLAVGDTVALTVFRDGAYRDLTYRLPERPVLPGDLRRPGALAPLRGRSRGARPPTDTRR
jgi:serine protease Do